MFLSQTAEAEFVSRDQVHEQTAQKPTNENHTKHSRVLCTRIASQAQLAIQSTHLLPAKFSQ